MNDRIVRESQRVVYSWYDVYKQPYLWSSITIFSMVWYPIFVLFLKWNQGPQNDRCENSSEPDVTQRTTVATNVAINFKFNTKQSCFKNLAKYSQNYPYQAQIQSFQPTSWSKIHNQNSCFITQIIKEQIKLQFLVNKSIFGTMLIVFVMYSRSTVGHDKVQFYLPLQ